MGVLPYCKSSFKSWVSLEAYGIVQFQPHSLNPA